MCSSTNIHSYVKKNNHRIMYACLSGNADWFRTLFSIGNIEALLALRTKRNETLFHYLLGIYSGVRFINEGGRLIIFRTLLNTIKSSKTIDSSIINVRNNKGNTVLHIACMKGNIEIVKVLCNIANIDFSIQNKNGEIPLYTAVRRTRNVDIVRELLKYHNRYDVNQQDNEGNTVLHMSCMPESSHPDIVRLLCNTPSIRVDIQNKNGDTPLIAAFEESHDNNITIIEELLECHKQHNISINQQDNDGNTAIHIASSYLNVEALKLLIAFGGDCSIRNNEGSIPIMSVFDEKSYYFEDGHIIETIEEFLLRQDKYDINSVDNRGNTILHTATAFTFIDTVELLLETNINPTLINHYGKTPYYLAWEHENKYLMTLLSKYETI